MRTTRAFTLYVAAGVACLLWVGFALFERRSPVVGSAPVHTPSASGDATPVDLAELQTPPEPDVRSSGPVRAHPAGDPQVTPAAADDTLWVEVFARGEPAADAPVRLEARVADRPGDLVQIATSRTGPEGEAAAVPLHALSGKVSRVGLAPADLELRVVAGHPGAGQNATKLSGLPPAGTRVRVDLGPSGHLDVALRDASGPGAIKVEARWRATETGRSAPSSALVWRSTSDASVRLTGLPLATEIALSAVREDRRAQTPVGQTVVLSADGATAPVELVLEPTLVVSGTAMLPGGRPVASAALALVLVDGRRSPNGVWIGKPDRWRFSVTTDAHGAFELPVAGTRRAQSTWVVEVELAAQDGAGPLRAEVTIPPGAPTDCGAVTLRPVNGTAPVLVVRVLDHAGRPVEAPTIHVLTRPDDAADWTSVRTVATPAPTAPDYALRTEEPLAAELAIDVGGVGYLPERRTGLVPGPRIVEFRLDPSVTLEGRVILAPGLAPAQLFHVQAVGRRRGRDLELSAPTFRIDGLAPELVDLFVRTQETGWTVAEIRGVLAGGSVDPRLDPLDLRELVLFQVLTLRDSLGVLMARRDFEFADLPTDQGGIVTSDHEGRISLAVPRGFTHIRVRPVAPEGSESTPLASVVFEPSDAPLELVFEAR